MKHGLSFESRPHLRKGRGVERVGDSSEGSGCVIAKLVPNEFVSETMKALAIALCVLVLLSVVAGFSLKVDKVEELISKKCFGRDYSSGGFIGREYLLGQINPVGNSIENLIALIEKIESKMPQLTALQTTIMILKRFLSAFVSFTNIKPKAY